MGTARVFPAAMEGPSRASLDQSRYPVPAQEVQVEVPLHWEHVRRPVPLQTVQVRSLFPESTRPIPLQAVHSRSPAVQLPHTPVPRQAEQTSPGRLAAAGPASDRGVEQAVRSTMAARTVSRAAWRFFMVTGGNGTELRLLTRAGQTRFQERSSILEATSLRWADPQPSLSFPGSFRQSGETLTRSATRTTALQSA
jgi:hypothetical protein